MEGKIYYFDRPGHDNTEEVFRIASTRAGELGIKKIVVPSTRGDTAVRAMEFFKGLEVVVVSYVTGMKEPDVQPFTEENRRKVESAGGVIVTAAHAFAGVNRAIRQKFDTITPVEIIAQTLRNFGQGMKVVCEISLIAADAGKVRTDEEVIVLGGTGRGVDTAVVLQPVDSQRFFDLRIKEILCKPRL
ncbi:MAG: pyruvate kinase alpha/beta domain-containing protein [Dehalococcoidales bacterium]|nr:pyruvate kinase alpha/beta domain-containing protein [Dehalococcoidales bacterium]